MRYLMNAVQMFMCVFVLGCTPVQYLPGEPEEEETQGEGGGAPEPPPPPVCPTVYTSTERVVAGSSMDQPPPVTAASCDSGDRAIAGECVGAIDEGHSDGRRWVCTGEVGAPYPSLSVALCEVGP